MKFKGCFHGEVDELVMLSEVALGGELRFKVMDKDLVGQDDWLGSSTFADQVPLWRGGDYLKLPLTPPAVAERFPRRLDLTPEG